MIENPVPWPNGARVAVAITFDIDADSILHLAHRDRSHQLVAAQSLLRYDRISVPRILDMYRNFGIKQTFFFPAWCMEQYPELVERILEGGHEIAHHGYIHEDPNEQSRDAERYWLRRGIEVIEKMTGKRPRGWRAPTYNVSVHSTDLLIEEGFLYDASLMGDDVPYVLQTERGEVLELPSHWALDDWPQYAHVPEFDFSMPIRSPDDAMRVYMAEFDAMWKYNGLWIAVWHPTVSGRLARCDRIATMIEEMTNRGGVWFATLEEIARHVAACRDAGTFEPRVEPMPTYAGPLPEQTFVAGA
jgi:peptidoglycan/xylan/chitin deacetylase (PgdA/CDA1 family)